MKTTVIEANKAKHTYPYLAKSKSTNRIVLFEKLDYGTVLEAWTSGELGVYKRWEEANFDRLPSGTKVILEQE